MSALPQNPAVTVTAMEFLFRAKHAAKVARRAALGASVATILRKVAAVDFETYFDKQCSVRTSGIWNYIHHPLFDAYLVSIVTSTGLEFVGHPKDAPWEQISGEEWEWVSHNASFDDPVYRYLQAAGVVPATANPLFWHCTADLCAYMGAPRSLAGAMAFLYGKIISKAVRDNMTGKRWDQLSPQGQQDMIDYARGDSVECLQLWLDYGARWPEKERRLSELSRFQGITGLRADVQRMERGIAHLKRLAWAAEQRLPWITTHKPLSPAGLAEACRKVGIVPPVSLAMDDEDCAKWEEKYSKQYPWVAAMRIKRRTNALLKKAETMLGRLKEDGRMTFGLKYFGASTGRWSGESGWNPQNLPQGEMFGAEWWAQEGRTVLGKDDEGNLLIPGPEFAAGPGPVTETCPKCAKKKRTSYLYSDGVKTWCPHEMLADRGRMNPDACGYTGYLEGWGLDLRKCIIPAEGCKFNIADLSQIEPRVLWYLVGDWEALKMCATGMSPYEVHARLTMGWTGGKLKDEDSEKYAMAKARVLALGYGAGWLKFITMARMYGADACFDTPVSEDDITAFEEYLGYCKNKEWNLLWVTATPELKRTFVNSWKTVKAFRDSNPKIVALWAKLGDAAKNAVGKNFSIKLPSGRELVYRNIALSSKIKAKVADLDCNAPAEVKRGAEVTAIVVKQGAPTRQRIYGGLLTENLVQACARDVFAEGLLRLDDADHYVPLHVHDEAVDEALAEIPATVTRGLLSQAPEWMPGLPVDSEAHARDFYTK